MNYKKNDLVRAKLGNFYFGGVVKFVVVTTHWQTKQEIHTYTVKLPCGIYVETTEIIGIY